MKYEKVEVNNERWFNLTPLLNEEFKDIKGFENLYQISNYGRVKSLERTVKQFNRFKICNRHIQERILKCSYDKDKYLIVSLHKDKVLFWKRVHQIMGYTFLGNDGTLVVNHKDLNKQNPRLDNLELCTEYENRQHAKNNGAVRKGKKIKDIKAGFIYNDYKDMQKALKIKHSKFQSIMYGRKEKRYIFIDDNN